MRALLHEFALWLAITSAIAASAIAHPLFGAATALSAAAALAWLFTTRTHLAPIVGPAVNCQL